MTDDSRSRRSVLRLAAASATLALVAGCGGPGEENGSEENGEPEFEEGTGNGQEREGEEDNEGTEPGEGGANGDDGGDEAGNDSESGEGNESQGGE